MSAPLPMMPGGAFDQLLTGLFAVPERRLDQMTALAYRGHLEGAIDEEQLERLTEAAQCRRSVFGARRRVERLKPLVQVRAPRPDRGAAIDKRRTWGASGALPPELRCRFTPGENAVAGVIRAEVRRHGSCSLPYSAIAKCAGLSGTTVVKRFVREARRTRLIDVQERPVPGKRHLPNVITIVSRDWQHWNEISRREGGGGTAVPPYQRSENNRAERTLPGALTAPPSASGPVARALRKWDNCRRRAHDGPGGRGDAG
jgi:hypothetical protein